jgi:hypothetical protein
MSQWQRFSELLFEEKRLMAELAQAAFGLTEALVGNDPRRINSCERQLESKRVLHGMAYAQRLAMQRRGFGQLTLRQVCTYAPPALRRRLYAAVHELQVHGIALRLTVQNNKALIRAGMDRLAKTVAVLQRAGTEQTGTYRRRGIIPPPSGSVLVSRRA